MYAKTTINRDYMSTGEQKYPCDKSINPRDTSPSRHIKCHAIRTNSNLNLANLQEDTILSLRWGLFVDGGLHDSRR